MTTKVCATFLCKEHTQVLKLSQESYDYMTSKECPEWEHKGEWNKMSKTQKLIKHLNRIRIDLNADRFTFEVFPD